MIRQSNVSGGVMGHEWQSAEWGDGTWVTVGRAGQVCGQSDTHGSMKPEGKMSIVVDNAPRHAQVPTRRAGWTSERQDCLIASQQRSQILVIASRVTFHCIVKSFSQSITYKPPLSATVFIELTRCKYELKFDE